MAGVSLETVRLWGPFIFTCRTRNVSFPLCSSSWSNTQARLQNNLSSVLLSLVNQDPKWVLLLCHVWSWREKLPSASGFVFRMHLSYTFPSHRGLLQASSDFRSVNVTLFSCTGGSANPWKTPHLQIPSELRQSQSLRYCKSRGSHCVYVHDPAGVSL